MKLDGDKLIKKLDAIRLRNINEKHAATEIQDYGEALMYHSAECTLENVIELIKSGDYTIKETK